LLNNHRFLRCALDQDRLFLNLGAWLWVQHRLWLRNRVLFRDRVWDRFWFSDRLWFWLRLFDDRGGRIDTQ
jgi:hypothetical protein